MHCCHHCCFCLWVNCRQYLLSVLLLLLLLSISYQRTSSGVLSCLSRGLGSQPVSNSHCATLYAPSAHAMCLHAQQPWYQSYNLVHVSDLTTRCHALGKTLQVYPAADTGAGRHTCTRSYTCGMTATQYKHVLLPMAGFLWVYIQLTVVCVCRSPCMLSQPPEGSTAHQGSLTAATRPDAASASLRPCPCYQIAAAVVRMQT
jgi:hypothetical protein